MEPGVGAAGGVFHTHWTKKSESECQLKLGPVGGSYSRGARKENTAEPGVSVIPDLGS